MAAHVSRFRALATGLVAILSAPALAATVAEKPLTLELPLRGGEAVAIEGLIGSIEIRGGGRQGTVVVEAHVLAEAATPEEARALADSIVLEERTVGGIPQVHVAFPLDRHGAFYAPRDVGQTGRTVAGWIDSLAALVGETSVTYDEREVKIGRSRGAVGLAVHLDVTIPDGCSSTFELAAGPIQVGRVRGAILAEVGRGRLIAEQIYGTADLRSSSGDVTLRTFRGETLRVSAGTGIVSVVDADASAVELRAGSGDAEVSRLNTKSLAVENGSGEMFLDGVEAVTYDIASGSGDVTFLTNLDRTQTGELRADSGNVLFRLGGFAPFRMEIVTASGSIRAEGKSVQVTQSAPTSAIVERGKGGSKVRVQTRSGDIRVAPR
jgi:hypothetical protein